jgi:hypothetical protein
MATEFKLSYTAVDINERLGLIDSMVKSVNGISPNESGNVYIPQSGLTSAAINLLVTILRNCATYNDQTANIDALEAALGGTEAPTEGVTQRGSILTITSGVTVTQNDNTLVIT